MPKYQERILVVEDNPAMRNSIKLALKLANFSVLLAKDGIEGLEKVHTHYPDLILLDLSMPRMNGMQMLDALNAENIDIPVILMTAEGNEEIAVEVFRRGVRDYLIKGKDSFDVDVFLESIQRCLKETRLQKERDQAVYDLRISNARLNRHLRDMKVLYEIGRSITALMDSDSLWQRIIGAATMLTGSEEAGVYAVENGQLFCRAIKRASDERPTAASFPANEPLAVRCIESRATVTQEPQYENQGAFIGTATVTATQALAAPLEFGGQVFGALLVRNVSAGATSFSDHEAALLNALAVYAAIAYRTQGSVSKIDTATVPRAARLKPKKVFISYKRSDYDVFVKPLVDLLKLHDMDVWVDQHLLEVGQDWIEKIEMALDECAVMVLCVSPEALASRYVQTEYRSFFHQGKPILPLICKPAPLPPLLIGIQTMRFSDVERLVARVKVLMSREKA
ncbi:MAG: response regulator [Anaerolineae bacterium]|nr:response regulator [Anaerolineae bacterium]